VNVVEADTEFDLHPAVEGGDLAVGGARAAISKQTPYPVTSDATIGSTSEDTTKITSAGAL